MKKERKRFIQSIEKAIDILNLLYLERKPLSNIEISNKLKLKTTTASNIIRTLHKRRFLIQYDNKKYFLGPLCYLLGTIADNWGDLRNISLKYIEEVSRETGDSVFLAAEFGGRLICIARSKGNSNVIVNPNQDWLDKLHCTASGKLIIAYKGIEWFKQQEHLFPLQKFTSKTLTDISEIEKEVVLILKKGYALSIDECAEGVSAISVPIKYKDEFIATFSQNFPSFFIREKKINLEKRVKYLKSVVENIERDYEEILKRRKI